MMFKLLKTKEDFESFQNSFDWHDSSIRESYSINLHAESFVDTLDDARESCDSSAVFGIVILLPLQAQALELVAFDPNFVRFDPTSHLEEEKNIVISRRKSELDLGTVFIVCGCFGYRTIDLSDLSPQSFHLKTRVVDEFGSLQAPYNIDWRAAMDEACAH